MERGEETETTTNAVEESPLSILEQVKGKTKSWEVAPLLIRTVPHENGVVTLFSFPGVRKFTTLLPTVPPRPMFKSNRTGTLMFIGAVKLVAQATLKDRELPESRE